MTRKRSNFFEDVIKAPWWVSVAIFLFGNFTIRIVLPAWFSGNRTPGNIGTMLSGGMAQAAPGIANMFSLVFGVAMIIACTRDFLKYRKSKETPPITRESTMVQNEVKSNGRLCPQCNSEMNIKTRNTDGVGQKYWVCGQYPTCRIYEPFEA